MGVVGLQYLEHPPDFLSLDRLVLGKLEALTCTRIRTSEEVMVKPRKSWAIGNPCKVFVAGLTRNGGFAGRAIDDCCGSRKKGINLGPIGARFKLV